MYVRWMFVNVNLLPEHMLRVLCGGAWGVGIKWAKLDGFDVKTWLFHLTSWVARDKLSELLGLSVLICKMELLVITLPGLEMMSVKSIRLVSAT